MKKISSLLVFIFVVACSKSDGENPNSGPEAINSAPTVPLQVFPTNGLLCTDIPLEFRWNSATDKDGDAISYEIEIASDASFNNILEKASSNGTKKVVALEKGLMVNWRVRAKDSKNGYSDFSPGWNFYTEGEGVVNYLPFTPTLIGPVLNTKVDGSSVTLEWSSSDVDGDNLVYDIYFGKTTPPALVEVNRLDRTLVVAIEIDQTYYWQIVVKDGNGGETIGDIWKFKS